MWFCWVIAAWAALLAGSSSGRTTREEEIRETPEIKFTRRRSLHSCCCDLDSGPRLQRPSSGSVLGHVGPTLSQSWAFGCDFFVCPHTVPRFVLRSVFYTNTFLWPGIKYGRPGSRGVWQFVHDRGVFSEVAQEPTWNGTQYNGFQIYLMAGEKKVPTIIIFWL